MKSRLFIASALFVSTLLSHCVRVTDGIEVDVAYQPAATPAAVRTDMGYRVRLERALITIGRVELLRCDNFVADLWNLVMPGRARAHELTSPTSLGVPFVIDLMESAGVPVFAGTLRPPPGRYCGIRVVGMPADEDAEGLTEQNLDMMDRSMFLAGRVEDAEGSEIDVLMARVAEVVPCELAFERPLELGSPVLESVSIHIDHTKWFDGIDFADFAQRDALAVQERITKNVRSSLKAVLPDWEDGL